MLLAVRLKWLVGLDPLVTLGRSVRLVCDVNVVNESFVWCRWWLTPVEGSVFQVFLVGITDRTSIILKQHL